MNYLKKKLASIAAHDDHQHVPSWCNPSMESARFSSSQVKSDEDVKGGRPGTGSEIGCHGAEVDGAHQSYHFTLVLVSSPPGLPA
jgi:hypothetical protein